MTHHADSDAPATAADNDLLLRNIRPMGGAPSDMLIRNGRIAQIAPVIEAEDIRAEDGDGCIVIPGLIEGHTHLDKTLLGMGWHPHSAGPRLIDKIENERAMMETLGLDSHRQSMRQALASVALGTTHIRSHVDIDVARGMAGVEGVAATRAALSGIVDIEIVAFPQSGLVSREGVTAMMEEAMQSGADIVGGLDPCGRDEDPKGQLDFIFGLAERTGTRIDIHLHEGGELGAFTFGLICDRVAALGMQGRVAVSHAFALGAPAPERVAHLIDRLAELDIRILTTAPPSRDVPSVEQLLNAGVKVGSGNDGVRDAWSPYGSGDMLERAMFVGMRNNFRTDEQIAMALDICTTTGAAAIDVENHAVKVGARADLVLVRGESLAEAVVAPRPRKLVLKAGCIVARDGAALTAAP